MQNNLESIDMELYHIAKNDINLNCVSCDDSLKEDDDYTYVCDDVYCNQCIIDADLIAYKYG